MTTTSIFVGFGDSDRVSSRVLKPPGGGSSISFGGYDVPVMKPKTVTPAKQAAGSINGSSPVAASAPAPAATPEAVAVTATADATEASASTETPPSPPVESSSAKTSNGTTNGSSSKPSNNDDFPPISVESNTSISSDDTEESPQVTNGTNGATTPVECKSPTPTLDVTKEPSVTPPSTPKSASIQSPTSPKVNEGDTKDRLFGYEELIATPAPVVRVTPSNHHMRSSIFQSSETNGNSYESNGTKTKTNGTTASSPTTEEASKPTPPAAPKPAPFHRVRQPPGGHCTQLW